MPDTMTDEQILGLPDSVESETPSAFPNLPHRLKRKPKTFLRKKISARSNSSPGPQSSQNRKRSQVRRRQHRSNSKKRLQPRPRSSIGRMRLLPMATLKEWRKLLSSYSGRIPRGSQMPCGWLRVFSSRGRQNNTRNFPR